MRFACDEHPRETSRKTLAKLKPVVRPDGTVTAGDASGVNDGACALLLADSEAARQYGLIPRARIIGMARAGVAPRVMGIGPAPAVQKLLRQFGLRDDDPRVNPNGGAIALGIGNSRD